MTPEEYAKREQRNSKMRAQLVELIGKRVMITSDGTESCNLIVDEVGFSVVICYNGPHRERYEFESIQYIREQAREI